MSAGNLKTEGQKGKNTPYQLRHLLALGEMINAINGVVPPGGLATETTLQAVLAGIDAMRDYETRVVQDSDSPVVTWLEVRYWDAQAGTLGPPVYYLPGSNTPGSPVVPLTYVNQQTLLNQILAELVGLNTPQTGLTPSLTRATGAAASVAAGARRVSFMNAGNSDTTVAGGTLERGELCTFSAEGLRDTLGAIAYDPQSSELVITEVR